MGSPDIVIAGAGLIGLACALECERRGLSVTVLERGRTGQEASWAAAGMLAAHDPANPPELQQIADFSLSLYPGFLERVFEMSGVRVPFETEWTLEQALGRHADVAPAGFDAAGFSRIAEQSLDPRKLIAAVVEAVRQSSIVLREATPMRSYREMTGGVEVQCKSETFHCNRFLDCTGAWSTAPIRPAKGQMLRLHAPGSLAAGALGNVVIRTPDIYLVPRLDGSVVIGATVEDAGFDKTVHDDDLWLLSERAAGLVPKLANAPLLESWAGLRPSTSDHLPLLGSTGVRTFIAAGHFRNGVLLAPATARVATQLLLDEAPDVTLEAFTPERFSAAVR